MWFKSLLGFDEESPEQVRNNILVDGNMLRSRLNGKDYICGTLETPTLAELRGRVQSTNIKKGKLSVREVVADVKQLHADNSNADSLFQVASQFNLLEMVSPEVTPEDGVDRYEHDHTQGPVCAIACGAGTVYRNYFADVNGWMGQSKDNQIDCLLDIGQALGNTDNHLWEMENGYAMATESGLKEIQERLSNANEFEIDELRQLLRIGIHWNTEVTVAISKHTVSQAYCSALPIAYSSHPPELWSEFAQLVLDASYEATFCAGILNYLKTGNNKLYLTLVGGGAFGSRSEWILNAIRRSISLFKDVDLDVRIVSYGHPNKDVQELVEW